MYGTLQMFLSDISTKQDQFENVDSCCAPKYHLWSENPFSRTEGTVDWEARLWQGALSISRPVSSSLRSGLMTLAHGLNSSRKALTIAVPPSVACKFQKPLLKVSDYPLSLCVAGVSLSSDFIAGFCGETEEDHLQTVSLLREVQYNMGFLFAYSMRQVSSGMGGDCFGAETDIISDHFGIHCR